MDWIKLLTNFDSHPKVIGAGLAGAGLFARALAYTGRYETDGYIPQAWVALAEVGSEATPTAAEILVEQGLWEHVEEGYRIRDFTEVNRSHSEMESLRKARSIAGKKGGKQKPSKTQSKSQANAKQDKSYSYSSSSSLGKASNRAGRGINGLGRLANLLADEIARNGSLRPDVTKGWLDAERLMLERDHRDPIEAEALIRWCQADEFWRTNILSMPKFRKQYDRLRLKAEADEQKRSPGMAQARRFAEEAERRPA